MAYNPTLIKTRISLNVSWDSIFEFEDNIINHSSWNVVNGPSDRTINYFYLFDKVLRIFNKVFILKNEYIALGFLIAKTLPYFSLPCKLKMLWFFDAWENRYKEIVKIVDRYKINILFISNQAACNYLNHCGINKFRAYWIPEAVDVHLYKNKYFNERDIDIIQLGRKWDLYHEKIELWSRQNNIRYLYEKIKGDIVFPDRKSFIEGLSGSKISICIPSSVTHPERSGEISTVTSRYFQSMASKCLLLGKKPEEMNLLFDYEPIIEIDLNNPTGQLNDILNHYQDYSDLIETNYEYVTKNHQWTNRIRQIESCIEDYKRLF